MTLSKPMKYVLLFLALYVAGVLYLHFRPRHPMGWGEALLFTLVITPVILLWWRVRDWMMDRSREAGEGMREARLARKRERREARRAG
ncbi:hypothetical protein AB0C93_19280 [Streptomyces sp. NPDC048518]|uniref:hypothetical protein n=1 Tax=Streptomyces sp. NPDC048518 TaxID=3155029 RepID=UPI0033C956F8